MTLTRETSDIDAQSELLRGWNQSYAQLSRGAFAGSLAERELGQVYLFRETTSQALFQAGYVGPEQVAIGVAAGGRGVARFCGQACHGGELHLFSGREGFEFYTPAGLDMVGAVLPRAVLGLGLDGPPRLLATPKAAPLRAMLLAMLAQGSGAAQQAAMCAALVEALRACLPAPCPQPEAAPRRDVLALVRARLAACEEGENPPDVESLCALTGLSRRSLQNLFNAEIGLPPSHYLRALRLNAARRRLRRGESVTEAATATGFWHFGRFSQEYRLQFGELPSQTARQFKP